MGMSVASVDGDDAVSVQISGLASYLTIKVGNGDVVPKVGSSYTFTAEEVNSGLTLYSNYTRGNRVTNPTVTATNTNTSEKGSTSQNSTSATLTVNDPPLSPTPGSSTSSLSLSDLTAQFGAAGASSRSGFEEETVGRLLTSTNPSIPDLATLTDHFMGTPFVSGGASGLLPSSLPAEEQRAFLALHQG